MKGTVKALELIQLGWGNVLGRFFAACLLLSSVASAADLVAIPELGLRIQRGFTIEMVADNDTAPDTWTMTFDARGQLVVANAQSIRTLLDTDGDALADSATVFAPLGRGAMGLYFEGTTLYAIADDSLVRYRDADGDSVADGPGERLYAFGMGEHGAHMVKKGPDGFWYVVGGNDTGFTERHVSALRSPIRKVEGGAFLRITPDFTSSECFAQGFRNPYDFSFNAFGDIFTFDSDTERDAFLPWYVPTRIYHVGFGQHHGWRLPGYKRSWPRPEYYADTVNPVARLGRGSPTGVLVYRHFQFPPEFGGGLFFSDWTFGRIYFAPVVVAGASYADLVPDVFIEPIDTQGFAPTAMAVAPDGSLYISIGGRKTRGAVYRVEYSGVSLPPLIPVSPNLDANAVLLAPQPLDSWSRATWVPLAQRSGVQPFAAVAIDERIETTARVRAIEVMTELFGGVPAPRVPFIARSRSPEVRARLAWSLGRGTDDEVAPAALAALAVDPVFMVRRCALEALLSRPELLEPAELARVLAQNLASADKDVRLIASKAASKAPADAWALLQNQVTNLTPLGQTCALLAEMWRAPDTLIFPQVVSRLTNHLARTREPLVRLNAVRLLILSMGDWRLNEPSVEVFSGYEPASPVQGVPEFAGLLRVARGMIPSGTPELDLELARLLAMLGDDDAATANAVVRFLTDTSNATTDFHYLACLARMRAPISEHTGRIARSILLLDRKLAGQEQRIKQSWDARLAELVAELLRREPSLADAMLRDNFFPLPAHVELANTFAAERRIKAARRFYAVARANPAFPWTPQLVELLSVLPAEEVHPLFRFHAANPGVRDNIVLKLAAAPSVYDRKLFLGSLGSPQPAVVNACLEALLKLPPDPSGTNLVAPLRLLQKATAEPAQSALRTQLLTLLSTNLKHQFEVVEPLGADVEALRAAYQPVLDAIGRRYPGLIRLAAASDGEDPVRWANLLRKVPWANGDALRGERIFRDRGCAVCHSEGAALGPDLAGSAQRMSRADLMTAIAFPSRDIAPPYRGTLFRLRDGQVINGIVSFESADGWLVQTGPGQSIRLDSRDVLTREPSNISLMPSGLLDGLSPAGIADLQIFLESLQRSGRGQTADQ